MHVAAQYTFLELLNGIWTVLDLFLIGWFTYYIYIMYRELEYFSWKQAICNWWRDGLPPHINAAIAIYVFTVGDTIVRAHIWLWRHMLNIGNHDFQLQLGLLVFGGVVSAVGLLCKIRVFTVYRLGNKAWISSLIVALVLVLFAWYTQID